eukprot:scaffold170795_cov22-Tisochrysis_lutea.AAC.1
MAREVNNVAGRGGGGGGGRFEPTWVWGGVEHETVRPQPLPRHWASPAGQNLGSSHAAPPLLENALRACGPE